MDCMKNFFVKGVLLDGRFETISALNHGSFGQVFTAKDKFTGSFVALKCLTKPSASNFCPSGFAVDDRSEELAIHSRLGPHPNVVNLITSFESETHIYLVLEFCPNGDLYEAIRLEKGPKETEHVRAFMLQLVDAVEYIHSKGVYHRDIKPENIFLTQAGSVKLGDFGLATTDAWSFESAVGSDRYMAPEQYDPAGYGYSTAAVDVWAIGICLLNVLFSRNPFGTPTFDDPLFADFSRDRQSLFDVFPNMHQDTYEVLVHCLAIDPSKRSLTAAREALCRVVSFTCEDEVFDDFCTDYRQVVPVTANREPLRTPSTQSPQIDNGSFPWAKALAMSPPPLARKLSAIPDTESYSESLFPTSALSCGGSYSVKHDNDSMVSVVDSGLGASVKSGNMPQPETVPPTNSRAVPIAGSLPVTSGRFALSMSSFFRKKDLVSKSWSDLWDEDEEEQAQMERDRAMRQGGAFNERSSNQHPASSGPPTPRCALAELKNPSIVNSRSNSPAMFSPSQVNEHTGFVFEEHQPVTPRYSPPAKRSFLGTPKRVIMDKWATLGERRRGLQAEKMQMMTPPSTDKAKNKRMLESPTGNEKQKIAFGGFQHPNDSGVYFGNFRHGNGSGIWQRGSRERKDNWSVSKDWRRSDHSLLQQASRSPGQSNVHSKQAEDDIGDLEWVGGWNDLHL